MTCYKGSVRAGYKLLLQAMLIDLILLSLFECLPITVTSDDACRYKGNMGLIDPECIRQMRAQPIHIRECYGIYYEPRQPSEDRSDITFGISIDKYLRSEYVDDLTYTIYSKIGSFSTPGSLSRVRSCESMRLNSTCTLPKRRDGEIQLIYLPVKYEEPDIRFCEFEIEERQARHRFCTHGNDFKCLTIQNGVIEMRHEFSPFKLIFEYQCCVFSIPDLRLARSRDQQIVYDVPGIKKKGMVVRTRHNGKRQQQHCRFMSSMANENIVASVEQMFTPSLPLNHAICMFVKGGGIGWTKKPVCYRRNQH